jgi:hypothetical protein
MTQRAYSFDKATLISILKGAGIAVGGALCTYLLGILPSLDVGTLTPMITAIASILINAIYQYIKGK